MQPFGSMEGGYSQNWQFYKQGRRDLLRSRRQYRRRVAEANQTKLSSSVHNWSMPFCGI